MAAMVLQQAMRSNDLTLITNAVSLGQRVLAVVPADHPDRAGCLSRLGLALWLRFWRVGALVDLDGAITAHRRAVQAIRADHPDRAAVSCNLGSALQARFERVGELVDLDEAITLVRAALRVTPADHPERALMLINLCAALRLRFGWVGELVDLDEAITVVRAAVHVIPADHPDRAGMLGHLGGALRTRFERVGALADLDEAITLDRAAVQATPDDHYDRATILSNLGIALHSRFERFEVQEDQDEAITVHRRAVQATPVDHPGRAMRLSNLGLALWVRFERMGALTDVGEAITVLRAAAQAIPADRPDLGRCLSNLGAALQARFGRAGMQEDLDEAITVHRRAVQATPADHPDRAVVLGNLGRALRTRFERAGVSADLDEVITMYAQAAEVVSGAPSVRISAARAAASLAGQTQIRRMASLLDTAVLLLAGTASRRLDRGDQQHALGEFAGLASEAASLAFLAAHIEPIGEPAAARALRLLELGRGVLLSQALDTRSDLTDLQTRHPALAARFIELREQLDQAARTSVLADGAGMAAAWEERRVEDRHQLAIAFEAVVTEIRALDGFESFLLPTEPDQLIRYAQEGPVVVVNVSRYRSDAVLVTSEGITSIPLPGLVQGALIDRINSFHQALGAADDPDASPEQRRSAQDTLSAVLEWLWDAVAQPILDELGYGYTPAPGTAWPRVWWVPTVRALGYARERNTASAGGEQALIVAMPTTPGLDSPLCHVVEEAELVHARLPRSALLIENPAITNSHLPTKANVLAQLGDCAIAHFACHGWSHPVDPSRSLLLLHDHDSDPLTVASLAPIRLDQARLAYLSACRTAFNPSAELADEAIHLTTAFQLAGYPHVVGTLWEIDDALAVHVADTFYSALATGDNTIDTRHAAQALHHAVRAIRDQRPETPSLWAAYLHAGA